ncbi:MAG TPA: hypothetical protein DCY39_03875 [Exiguobacterium sp.]|nr:hypothetical protein [Exiguobacterium sp.]
MSQAYVVRSFASVVRNEGCRSVSAFLRSDQARFVFGSGLTAESCISLSSQVSGRFLSRMS